MKRLFFTSLILSILISCAPNSDKKGTLEKLKSERETINNQITKLESEVNPNLQKASDKSLMVKAIDIKPVAFNHFVEIQGVVDADQNVSVSPQTPGVVTAVFVKEGSFVKKGDTMATLDALVLIQSKEEVKTQLDLASIIFEKQKNLWEKKIGSEIQFLQAKAGKESLERRIKTIDEQIEMTKVKAPISGSVESVPLKVGQLASPGLPTSTIRVINMSNAKVSAEVSENYAAKIKNGNDALIRFPDLGQEISTKLSFTSKFIDPSNRTFRVECRISSKEVELRANMIAYIRIKDYSNDNAIVLPVNIVQSNQDGKFVYSAVKQSDVIVATRKYIKTGMDYNGEVEILSGISAGDKIITAGYQSLKEGTTVNF